MRWQKPQFSDSEVDQAGQVLISDTADSHERDEALEVLDNWRAAHAFPLNSLQMNLRGKAERVYQSALVAQRLKRTVSIEAKLKLRSWIRLSTMQDIGGCRAVVRTPSEVFRIREAFRSSRSLHRLVREKDYILHPKEDTGYRSLHLVYAFATTRATPWDGLQTEIQIRTRVQHAWATAVETVGFLVNQALKSNLGDAAWRDFFRLAAAAFAIEEGCAPVPGVTEDRELLRRDLEARAKDLKVAATLQAFGVVLSQPIDAGLKRAEYFLLTLRPVRGRFELSVRGFERGQETRAEEEYSREQRQLGLFSQSDSVLVRVASVESLRRSYPNYYLDTDVFLERLERFIAATPGRVRSGHSLQPARRLRRGSHRSGGRGGARG